MHIKRALANFLALQNLTANEIIAALDWSCEPVPNETLRAIECHVELMVHAARDLLQLLKQQPTERAPNIHSARRPIQRAEKDACDEWFSTDTVATIFSSERSRALGNGGKYSPRPQDYSRLEAVVSWAVETSKHGRSPKDVVRESVAKYLASGAQNEQRGYPFAFWACDPGAWLVSKQKNGEDTRGYAENNRKILETP